MKNKTLFTIERFNNYYYIKEKMMIGTDHGWHKDGNGGKNDALWRTGWSYITYNEKILKEGILSCFTDEVSKKGKKYIQAHRFPGQGSDDVSRDQITAALIALSINGDYEDVKRIRKGLKWKISKKFKLTIDMWLWMMSISTKQPFAFLFSLLFTLTAFLVTAPMTIWNNILYKWCGIKEISPETQSWLLKEKEVKNTKDISKIRKARNIHYPAYALHLFAWQVYSSPWNPLKRLLKIACRPSVHKSNYVMKILFGSKIDKRDVIAYKPMSGIRWQDRFFKGVKENSNIIFYSATEIIAENYHFRERLGLTSDYNALDNDMLWYLVKKHPKQVK